MAFKLKHTIEITKVEEDKTEEKNEIYAHF